jgi:putative hydrolase of the HAD superfamily
VVFGAVVFDLFVTLTDFDAERRRPALEAELAIAAGVDPVAFSGLMRATFTDRVTGGMGDIRSTLAALFGQLGSRVSGARLDALVALRYQQQRQVLAPRAGAIEAIGAVRSAGYATGILTDCTADTADLWPALPYAAVVDAVSFSCQVGRRKPDPAGYLDIAGKLGVAPAACLYVGDGASSELTGATEAGMTAVLLETPLDGTFRYDAETGWSGLSIAGLEELPGLLARS